MASPDLTPMDYEKDLLEIYPTLERLGKRMKERSNGKIVWMMQYHYFDRNSIDIRAIKGNSNKFHSKSAESLNAVARSVFR